MQFITLLLVRIYLVVPDISKAHHVGKCIFFWVSWMSLVPVTLPHGPLALSLVLPGPVRLLAVLAAVGRVPATPVDGLGLALVTLEQIKTVSIVDRIGKILDIWSQTTHSILKNHDNFRIFESLKDRVLEKLWLSQENLPIVSSWSPRLAVSVSPRDFPFLKCGQPGPAPGLAPDSWDYKYKMDLKLR